ncbi:methylmalonyl-CoA epimerase [Verrucomicrobia bacterium]|nr:methylmalonyl-CoA epimerase [Verrucomicrobiota bacterium]
MVKNLDHIAIATQSIDESLPVWQKILGSDDIKIETVESQKVKVAFIKIGDVKIELLEPLNKESVVQKYLDKKGPGLHHIAFKCEELEESVLSMREKGVEFIEETRDKGANNTEIIFIHPGYTKGTLVEINAMAGKNSNHK